MHIVYIVEKLGPYHIYRLSSYAKHKITILETRPGSTRYSWLEDLSITNLKVESLVDSNKIQLFRLLDTMAADCLCISGYGFIEMLWALEWGIGKQIGLCLLSDSTQFDANRSYISEQIKSRIVGSFHTAVVAGKRSENYIKLLGMPAQHVFKPYDVIDNEFYAKQRNSISHSGKEYFLCISRLVPKKNLNFLINAYADFLKRNSPIELVILGDGELESSLREQIAGLGLDGLVHLMGFLHGTEVRDYYHRAKGLILASTSEQWGLCINEAIAAGTPVICSTMAGACEDLIDEGESGYSFSPYSKPELVQRMECLCAQTPLERQRMIQNAGEKLKYYTRENFQIAISAAADLSVEVCHRQKKNNISKLLQLYSIKLVSTFMNS